jgi:protein-S-isoprenylcysteine O-methyltransferase Ste14
MRFVHGILNGLRWIGPFAATLLLAAGLAPGGTWIWPRGWAFLATYGGLAVGGSVALALFRPASFQVRRQGLVARAEQRQPWLDAVGTVIYIGFLTAWTAFIPLDVFWLRLLPAPAPLVSTLGGAATVAGVLIVLFAVAQNRFAAPTVQDQTADGQHVVDTGLYSLIRHPLYAGNLLAFAGMALWLGSYAALGGVLLMLLFTAARIAIEERELRARLPAYADYARRVRGRLIPFVL